MQLKRLLSKPRSFASHSPFGRRWLRLARAALLPAALLPATLLPARLVPVASAQTVVPEGPPPDESVLGELLITGDVTEHITPLAVLPSLSPVLEDVIVRGVVRRDFELTGMFKVIPDEQAPEGLYGFNDPVDVKAWSKLGAEVII
jgi:hypothetical protein